MDKIYITNSYSSLYAALQTVSNDIIEIGKNRKQPKKREIAKIMQGKAMLDELLELMDMKRKQEMHYTTLSKKANEIINKQASNIDKRISQLTSKLEKFLRKNKIQSASCINNNRSDLDLRKINYKDHSQKPWLYTNPESGNLEPTNKLEFRVVPGYNISESILKSNILAVLKAKIREEVAERDKLRYSREIVDRSKIEQTISFVNEKTGQMEFDKKIIIDNSRFMVNLDGNVKDIFNQYLNTLNSYYAAINSDYMDYRVKDNLKSYKNKSLNLMMQILELNYNINILEQNIINIQKIPYSYSNKIVMSPDEMAITFEREKSNLKNKIDLLVNEFSEQIVNLNQNLEQHHFINADRVTVKPEVVNSRINHLVGKDNINDNEKVNKTIEESMPNYHVQYKIHKTQDYDKNTRGTIYSNYLREKANKTNLGNLKFSDYVVAVRPDLVGLIEDEKEKEGGMKK